MTMDDWLKSFSVALGFQVDAGSLNTAKKSIADYEAAVKSAEKRIEDARWAGAKSEQEIAKLTRETNLREAKDALAAAQQREKAEAEQLRKREQHAKEFSAAWSRMALAATAAATAISYAVNRVTQAFDSLGFVSARTGASVQSLNSLGYAFKQVGGSSQQAVSAVEKFAQALRTNDGLKGYVKSLGIDTTKDMADQLLDTVDALSKHQYQVGSREAGMLGISEEDYQLLTQYAAKVKEYRAEYDATTKALGVNSKEAADASMAFQRSLNRLTATASALGDKLMVSLAPALRNIVDRFQEWIRSNPEKVEHIMDGISKAAIWLAEKIGAFITAITGSDGEAFIKRWDVFAERVERVAHNVERIVSGLVRLIGFVERLSGTRTVLGDGSRTADILNRMRAEQEGGAIGYATPGTVRDDRSWWQRHAPRSLGGRDAPAPTGGTPSGSSAGNLTALIDAEAARAGIDPRIMHGIRAGESGKRQNGNDPAAAYDKKDDALESSWGPFQLNRRRGLGVQFEKETGLDVRDPRTIPDQVRWVAEGLKKNGRGWLRNWMGYHGDRDADPRWGDSGYVPSPQPAGSSQVAGGAHPLAGVGRVSSDYGMRTHPILGGRRMHAGIDLAAPAGTSVQSMTAGLVSISPSGDVTIKQGDGSSTTYRHVVANVADGARVAAGQVIAQLRARDPRSTGPHLHFEARDKDGNLMDPKSLLAPIPASQRAQAAAKADFSRSRIAPRMDPGGFDVNALTKPAPLGSPAIQNSTTTNRAVHQTINNTTTITGADRPREAARIMEAAFGNMHGLALRNAQSAVA
ncbi:peptidoglycan DD-metalloendopeptidase family protein [Methylobacterium sp. 22177]|uniref:M23 family metallopeptidase n=1 Tax=Methylobacterium sp. 22177 TaxID=3453885 RepID=UPI003F82A2B7